jgi:hypothetical protein
MSLNQRVTAEFSTCTPSAPPTADLSIQTIYPELDLRAPFDAPDAIKVPLWRLQLAGTFLSTPVWTFQKAS